jgi:Transglycosylase SLT domain
MTNLKRSTVSYRPFQGQAILQDGLLAVSRPGGEVQQALAGSLFGAADILGRKADREAQGRIEDAVDATRSAKLSVDIQGGDRGPDTVVPRESQTIETTDLMPKKNVAAPQNVRAVIANAAARHGVPLSAMIKTAQLESSFDPSRKNPASSAGGLYQQIDDNAAQYGVKNRFDPAQSADGAARFMRDNLNYLKSKLGRQPTDGELYLAHQQGPAGAVALLRDPNVSAASVVGARRVKLNGGSVDMTAGEFAALWTKKAGDAPAGEGFGAMPEVDLGGDGFDIVQGERSPLEISVEGDAPTLSPYNTSNGRAYNRAVSNAYSSRLQDEMLSATDELAAKYADDPAGMREAFELLKDRQLTEHVPDSVKADYEVAFSRITRRQLKGAQTAYEKKLKVADESEWLSNGTRFEESLGQAQIGLEAGDDDGMTAIAGHAQRMKQHWREGVAKGFVTPRQAREAAQRLDSDVAAQWYVAQAKDARPDDIDALRGTLEADYAAGKLKGVDARGWTKIDTALKRQAAVVRQDEAAASAKLGKIADGVLDRAALGYEIAPEEINAMRGAAGKVDGGDDIVSATLDVLDVGQLLRNEPVGAAEEKLQKMKDLFGKTPTTEEALLIDKAETLVKKSREALSTDLLGYAERSGVIENPGSLSDVKTAEDMQALIDLRVQNAAAAATHFGVAEQYFRPGEVKALEDMVMADPDAGAAMAASILTGSGDKVGAVLKEFGNTAPVLAGAGAILAGGGDAVAARDAIAGAGKDAEGKAYSEKGWQVRKDRALGGTGLALIFQQDDERRVISTAERIARKRIADAGLEPDSDEAMMVMDRAVNEAAGAVYDKGGQWGGFAEYDPGMWQTAQKVAVPNSIRADRLGDVIDVLQADDFAVQPQGGVDRLQELWPVLTAGGYVFVDFDGDGAPVPLGGVDGKPFVLNLGAMGAKLGARVPGAFRGY